MKKILCFAFVLVLCLGFSACGNGEIAATPAATPSAAPAETQDPAAAAVCTIVDIYDSGVLLLAGEEAGDVYTLSPGDTPISRSGEAVSASDLAVGQTLTIRYDGPIEECYPGVFGSVTALEITAEGTDLTAMYLRLFKELWEMDSALNADTQYLGLDVESLCNLTAAERAALVWRCGELTGLIPVTGTFEELSEAGYIDRENLYWEDGVLVCLEVTQEGEDSFTFDAEKWRSGLGAIFFSRCEAQCSGSTWSYTLGSFAIA